MPVARSFGFSAPTYEPPKSDGIMHSNSRSLGNR